MSSAPIHPSTLGKGPAVHSQFSTQPPAQGLYDPRYEHDSCGVAMVATLTGVPSNDIVAHGLTALRNLDHRGAVGGEPDTGDGAGMLLQVPDRFLREIAKTEMSGVELPEAGTYAVGMAFLPVDADQAAESKSTVETIAGEEGLTVLGWREVPVDPEILGSMSRGAMPSFELVFITATGEPRSGIDLDRLAFCLRKRAEHEAGVYFPSLSARTLVYKGMLTTKQLDAFFPDLRDKRMESALCIVHSRFSTNTFPSWPLAHPFRFIAHNGEINTARGNRNWMRAREATLESDLIPGDLKRLFPICDPEGSDTASFDEVLELLHLGGRDLPHAVMMMIPEAWENDEVMDPARRAFYEFHSSIMEPWDGPACVSFTDGNKIGAVLDRNGLRPGRFWITEDGLVVLASEAGVLDIDQKTITRKGRLEPGKMFLLDLSEHRVIEDTEVKATLAAEHPYDEWLYSGLVRFDDLPDLEHIVHTHASVTRRQQVFGYTEEELRILVAPIARTGAEAIGSMGTDTPIAALSDRPRLLFDYFSQLFAQVTNPPLDAIREEVVTSLAGTMGPEANLLTPSPASCRMLQLPFPVIDNDELAKIRHMNRDGDMPGFAVHVVRGLYDVHGGGKALKAKLDEICEDVSRAVADGARIIVLSDRHSDADLAPIPSLLLTGAVHHHMVREKLRSQAGLLVETGDVREVHHVALLIGYGATAVNPYLALESAEDLAREGNFVQDMEPGQALRNLAYGLGKGVLKVMSKMGVSTVASYTGAQIFEAVGLSDDMISAYFTGTSSKLGGVGLDVIAQEVASRHAKAYPTHGIVGGASSSRRRWRVPVAPRGPGAPVRPRDGLPPPALHPHGALRHLQAVHQARRRPVGAAHDAARPARVQGRHPAACADRRGRAGLRDRQEVQHRRDVVRLDQPGGARDAGDRHEPDRRPVEHRRGWGGRRTTPRPGAPLGDQAGGVRTLRRHERVPHERRRPPDQDGAGCQAGRGWTAARSEGVPVDRQDPLLDTGRRADLTAAAPRHLLDRGPQAAHPRPQERQPVGPCARQARRRDRRGHGRGRCLQGQGRRRADLRPRRRHGSLAAHVAQARRRTVGAGPRRDPADAAAQRPARPHRRADGRPAEDRARRR